MYVDCTKFDDIWNKAKSNVGEKDLLSTYTWSEGVVSVERNGEPIAKDEKAPAVFFDNAEYPVWVDVWVVKAINMTIQEIQTRKED